MDKADIAHWYGPKARLRLAALGISLALHGLLLGFIGQWHVNAPPFVPSDPQPPVYLQLEPRPVLPGERARRAPGREETVSAKGGTVRPDRPGIAPGQTSDLSRGLAGKQPEVPDDDPVAPVTASIDPDWRIAPEHTRGRSASVEVCRDISNFRAWEAADCRKYGPAQQAEARGSPPAEIARPEAHRGSVRGETAKAAFAEQAAANEEWRNYTRGDGPYPGLRSLARHY